MDFELIEEKKLEEIKAFHTNAIRDFQRGLFNKIIRITQTSLERAIDDDALKIVAVNATQDDMPIKPVLFVYPRESKPFVVGISGRQFGDGENDFSNEEIEYIEQLANQSDFEYEVGGE